MSVELTDKSILENENNPTPENNMVQNNTSQSENAVSMVTNESPESEVVPEATNNNK